MSMEVLVPVAGILAVFAAMLVVLGRHLKPRHRQEAREVLERLARTEL